MTLDDAAKYVGKKYHPTGTGPDVFNCWGLLRWIQKNEFGRFLPEVPIGDAVETRRIHDDSLAIGVYELVSEPIHGDCVLLRSGNNPHVGVYLELDGGGVLHSLENVGVIWTPILQLNRFGFARKTFYRVNANGRSNHSTKSVSTDG